MVHLIHTKRVAFGVLDSEPGLRSNITGEISLKAIKKAVKSLQNIKEKPFKYGAPSGIRTRDPLIKSQLLYQLS